MIELAELTAAKIAGLVQRRELSARAVTTAALDRIAAVEPRVRAYLHVDADGALAAADALDARLAAGHQPGPLAGVPLAIKDNLCTRRGPTTCASRMLANFSAPYNATVIERLLAADAIVLGKTNLDEFAMGSSTENSGFHTSRNPWNLDCVPGGSSGGSAAAVAAFEAIAAVGSDTGGSIRQPAALCGLFGLKPTYGLISRYGLVAFASSLDQVGPLTRDARDAALLLNVMAGRDPRDSTSIDNPVADYTARLDLPLSGLRLGLPIQYRDLTGVDPQVVAAFNSALKVYQALGATTVEVDLPHAVLGLAAYYIIAPAEASSNLARYDGVHYGHRSASPQAQSDLMALYMTSRAEGFGPEVKRRIMLGTFCLSKGYGEKYYDKALRVRRLIANDFTAAFAACDLIATPTTSTAAFRIGEKSNDPLAMYLCDLFTIPANLAGLPAASVNVGFTDTGLPIGLHLAGPVLSEETLLRAARMFEIHGHLPPRRPAL